jgi:hypothetical protein
MKTTVPKPPAETGRFDTISVLRRLSRTGTDWRVLELRRAGVERSVGNKGADESGLEAEGQEARRGFSLCAAPS